MTTNIDRAVKRILDAETEYRGHPYDIYPDDLRRWLQALAEAGLLMPDLPEIDKVEGNEYANVYSTANGLVCLYAADNYGDDPMVLDPDDARDVALALLAAANYAEEHANDQ